VKATPLLALFLLAAPLLANAQDVDTQYLRLQEAYSQKLQDLEQQFQLQQRELLNKFIIALVRTEKTYLEEGNLDGVMMSRELREDLLQNPEIPTPVETWPERILQMAQELERRGRENLTNNQTELDRLNSILLKTLEPYKVEFTRQGNLETAIEVRDLQNVLSEALDIEVPGSASKTPRPIDRSNDPNAYNFAFEAPAFQQNPRVSPRPVAIELDFEIGENVFPNDRGYLFDGGTLQLEARDLEPLRANASRNQLMTFEVGITPSWQSQGNNQVPAPLFVWGDTLNAANIALTQEGRHLFLYLTTTNPPLNRSNHRVDLGAVQGNTLTHILVMYKANEFTIFRDGVVSDRIRGEITGSFRNWEEKDAVLGHGPLGEGNPTYANWYGHLHQLCIKAGQDVSRRATDFYARFEQALSE